MLQCGPMIEVRTLLRPQDWAALQRKSTIRALWAIAVNWGLVAAGFALAIAWPTPLGVLVALVVIGGRQLGLGILMHDCAHRALFPSAAANDRVGQWLCAAPVFADLEVYRRYHMTHHRTTGTEADPDLPNYRGYPVSWKSFARKVLRDLSGLTGLRAAAALLALYAHADPKALELGYSYRRADEGTAGAAAGGRSFAQLAWNLRRVLLAQGIGIALLLALGHPLAWLLWPGAWLTKRPPKLAHGPGPADAGGAH